MGIPVLIRPSTRAARRNVLISPVACLVENRSDGAPKLSGACRLRLRPGYRLAGIYRTNEVEEEYFCNYEVNPGYQRDFETSSLLVTAIGENGGVRAIELPDRRF